jgi:coenzyme F420-dependent glucose-6-phosphate dehydrogenase
MTHHPLKLGYKASAEQFGPRQLLDFAVEAEEAGFESVWISDHFQPWRHTHGHAPFAPAWLGAVGERSGKSLRPDRSRDRSPAPRDARADYSPNR